jgi:hypothetical protein
MKKIYFTLALTALATFSAMAQPVANASNVAPNFTGEFYFAPATNFSPGAAGANQTWNYASLQLTLAGTDTAIPVVGSPFAATFPGANYCYKFSGPFLGADRYYYHNLTSTKFEIVSMAYNASSGDNYMPNPRTFAVFPYTYNTVYTDTYKSTTDAIGTSFTATYDAYGTLVLPTGTYNNVIRQKIVKNGQTDYVWFNVSPFYPLLQTVLAENSLGIVKSTMVLGVHENDFEHSFSVSPNPSEGIFQLTTTEAIHVGEINIYDMLGNRVKSLAAAQNSNTISIDLQDCTTGIYFIAISDKNSGLIYREKIIKK